MRDRRWLALGVVLTGALASGGHRASAQVESAAVSLSGDDPLVVAVGESATAVAANETSLDLMAIFLAAAARLDALNSDRSSRSWRRANALRSDLNERLRGGGQPVAPSEVMALASRVDQFRTRANQVVPLPPQDADVDIETAASGWQLWPGAESADAPSPDEPSSGILAELLSATPESVEALRLRTITLVDWWVIAIIGAAAIWSGLEFLYFGKAWGNTVDLVSAVFWAFGVTATLTLLVEALGQADERNFRLRPAK